jgi:hypothetical protein
MSTTRHPRFSRHHGNRSIGPHTADDDLGRLLAAAVPPRDYRPVSQGEFRGEAAAVDAFREARLYPASRPRRRSMSAGKLLAVKAAVAAVAVCGGGGVALAAASGHLPAQSTGQPAAAASPTGAHAAGANSGHPSAAPSPALQGLCHAYAAGAGSNPGKALDNPAFTALITAAGGKGKVSSYCGTLLKSPSSAASGNAASHSANGAAHSAKGKASHPTSKPTELPTSAATSHPTGKPASRP